MKIDGRTETYPQGNGDRLLQTRREMRQKQDSEWQTKIKTIHSSHNYADYPKYLAETVIICTFAASNN